MIGCSGIGHNARPKPEKKLFNDNEISAFMEDEEPINDDDSYSLSQKQQNIQSTRPIWAREQFLNLESKNYIARVGYSKIGNSRRQDVSDSLRDKIREKLARDVKTHIEQETIDSVSTKIFKQGNQKATTIRKHITTVISRHYSNIVFNGVYDESSKWVDQRGDTLWYLIKYNKTKYILDEQRRILEEIRKAGDLAYQYIRASYKALSLNSDMEKSLAALGVASFHISKGGGSAIENDLFNPGK